MEDARTPVAKAAYEQLQASDPGVSAFVSAHAGAGKTKLLIDRLLRLMLSNADPARILCLTFTKAAAAEMSIRLQKRLAGFVALSDPVLDDRLKALLIAPTPDARIRARALFARVLDLPGGMRISTIHAFCQSLLRRFPLEAEISPHFQLVEDDEARIALDRARERVLPQADPAAVAALAGLTGMEGFAGLTALLERERQRLQPALSWSDATLQAALHRVVGATASSPAELIARAAVWADEAVLRDALRRMRLHGAPGASAKAAEMEGWLNLSPADRAENWGEWLKHFFTDDGAARKPGAFSNPKLTATYPDILAACEAEQGRLAELLQSGRALRCASASGALLKLATGVLLEYAGEKKRSGLVDYDDLIRRTVSLLSAGGAAWVKYKLDGGIDHVLLDEVQDTSAVQWDVTDALTEDFFTGENAREGLARTIFAVGDIKQSIYSFQGAEPDAFEIRRARYAGDVRGAGRPWRETVLDVSFRSTVPVLAAVDAVFADGHSSCGVCGPGSLSHVPNRLGQAGSVTVWPLTPRPPVPAPTPWAIPAANQNVSSAPEDLVRHLAAWIATQIEAGTMLESAGRPMRAGDFLVLVRRRGQFDRALVRELKKRGVAVAGLDRMKLTQQLAVQDLVALCEALLLPQDDLTLAEMLTSPLGGLSDDSLMDLASGRHGTLWETLRARAGERPEWRDACDFFTVLLGRVDYAQPYAILAEALGRLGGRARLFARLGPEAAEPIDELLSSAQTYATRHTPSLQGFLHWLDRSGAEVKREAASGGDVLRIMTVHGAKGLEAPIVILPDTVSLPPDQDRLHWTRDRDTGAELFLWVPNKDFMCAAVQELRETAAAKRIEEYNRLFYVAMTRARDHLLVCGWQPKGDVPPEAWYAQAQRGLSKAGATAMPHVWGEALRLETPQTASQPDTAATPGSSATDPIPSWAGAPPLWQPTALPAEPLLPRPLSPSRPQDARFGPVPPSRSPLLRPAQEGSAGKGLIVHAMLQHLPELDPADWDRAALAYAMRTIPEQADSVANQVLAVLRDPAFANLFLPGSRAEQGLSGVVGGQVVTGRVDRLYVRAGHVLVADFKTSRTPPASAADVPVLYLRQMAAYRGVLALLYPASRIECVLVWTEGPSAMVLPDSLMDSHMPGLAADR